MLGYIFNFSYSTHSSFLCDFTRSLGTSRSRFVITGSGTVSPAALCVFFRWSLHFNVTFWKAGKYIKNDNTLHLAANHDVNAQLNRAAEAPGSFNYKFEVASFELAR